MVSRVCIAILCACLSVSTVSANSEFWREMIRLSELAWGRPNSGLAVELMSEYRLANGDIKKDCDVSSAPYVLGWIDLDRKKIMLNGHCHWVSQNTARETLVIIEHEHGHFLGLRHSSDFNSVMYWYNDGQYRTITIADRTNLLFAKPVERPKN